MRKLALALALTASPALAATEAVMHRDAGCICCEKWAAQVRKAFGRSVQVIDDGSRTALQRRLGVPAGLSGCHTAVIDGMVFEGHVPIADMQRVLAAKPPAVRGLAVPGMPLGSLGMESPGYPTDRYAVVAFGPKGSYIYARH